MVCAGNAWQADHIKAVHLGGGLCDITNFRTLCTVCHMRVTKEQATRRAQLRAAGNTHTITALFSSQSELKAPAGPQKVPQDVGDVAEHALAGRSAKRKAGALAEALGKAGQKRLAGGKRRGLAATPRRRLAVQSTIAPGGQLHRWASQQSAGDLRSRMRAQGNGSGAASVTAVDSDSDFETDSANLLRPPARGGGDVQETPCTNGDPGMAGDVADAMQSTCGGSSTG